MLIDAWFNSQVALYGLAQVLNLMFLTEPFQLRLFRDLMILSFSHVRKNQ